MAAVLAPVLLGQGLLVLRRTPTLPEAAGPRHGSAGAGEPLQVVVLGESTAAGVGVDRMADALAAQFARELAGRTERQVRWTVSARTGATARYTRHALLPAAVRERSDVSLVVLGVNDTFRMTGRTTWRRTVEAIVTELRASGGRVLLAGVPDLGTFTGLPQPLRTVLGRQSRMLDGELRALADGTAVQHAPMPPLDALPAPFARDDFHPNADAYRVWGAQLAGVASG